MYEDETKEKIPLDTSEEDQEAIEKVMTCYSETEGDTKQRLGQHIADKAFIMGEEQQHFEGTIARSDETRRIVNISAAIALKFQEYIAGIFPEFQIVPYDGTKAARAVSDTLEKVVYDFMLENDMPSKFADNALEQSMLGTCGFTLNYDPKLKSSGRSGIIINQISMLRVRPLFSSNDWRELDGYLTTKRFSLPTIKRLYGIDVQPDGYDESQSGSTLAGWIGATGSDKTFPGPNANDGEIDKTKIPMATVFNYWDADEQIVIVGGTHVVERRAHNFSFVPLYLVRNFTIPNEPYGKPDHYWTKDLNKSLNYLTSKAEGIIKYQAGPIILDYGNTLKGRSLPAGNNVVVPLSSREQGTGLEYLEWKGQFFPLMEQIKVITGFIHDITGMPQSAFGSYQPGVRSAFQQQVQMQPLISRIDRKKIEWERAFSRMVRDAIYLIKKFDKVAGKQMPDGVENLQVKVVWKSPLSQDEAKEVQNISMLKNLHLISDYTAMERLRFQSPADEMDQIKEEDAQKAQIAQQQQSQNQEPAAKVSVNVKADAQTPEGQQLLTDVGLQTSPNPTSPSPDQASAGTGMPEGIASGNPQATTPQGLANEIQQNTPGPNAVAPGEKRPYPTTPQASNAAINKVINQKGGK